MISCCNTKTKNFIKKLLEKKSFSQNHFFKNLFQGWEKCSKNLGNVFRIPLEDKVIFNRKREKFLFFCSSFF